MADDIQSAFKEAAATKSGNKWMVFVAIGFLAGAVFGAVVMNNLNVQAQAKEICGDCQANLEIMLGNFNMLAKTCSEATPYQYQRNISILPGIINETVSVYAT